MHIAHALTRQSPNKSKIENSEEKKKNEKVPKVLWQQTLHVQRNCEMKYIEYVYSCGIYHACVVRAVCIKCEKERSVGLIAIAGMSRHHRSLVKN